MLKLFTLTLRALVAYDFKAFISVVMDPVSIGVDGILIVMSLDDVAGGKTLVEELGNVENADTKVLDMVDGVVITARAI